MDGPQVGVFLPTMSAPDLSRSTSSPPLVTPRTLGFESVWAVDQLIAGTGAPLIDSMIALSAAAGATDRVKLGLGVVIVPLRPVAWIAKQVASMQQVSGGRVLLGVGVGGDRHDRSWAATGVPRQERGVRTDAAVGVLPDLIAGKPVRLPDVVGSAGRRTRPRRHRAADPRRWHGGCRAAGARSATATGGSRCLFRRRSTVPSIDRLRQLATDAGREAPAITGSIVVALDGDPSLPSADEIVRRPDRS